MKALILTLLAPLGTLVQAAEFTKEPLSEIQRNIEAKKAILVDTRGQEEWADGHVDGAVFLPWNKFRKNQPPVDLAKVLPRDKIIYTHCAVGMRAMRVGKVLEELGYDVRPMKSSYDDLIKAGFKKARE